MMADGMYQIAKEIELSALTTYRSKNFIETMNTNILNMEKVADRRGDLDGDHEYR